MRGAELNVVMAQHSYRFIVQALDPHHGCPVIEALFEVTNLDELRGLLGACAHDDPELIGAYSLDEPDLIKLNERYGLAFDPGGREIQLCPWHSLRVVPYLVHTGYELPLMLEGRKPFSYFAQEYPPHHHFGEEYFEVYVSKGVIQKRVELQPFPAPLRGKDSRAFEGIRSVFYTLNGEEWRIPAWKLIRSAAQKSRWNADFERLEGMLLGYEEWQNDWWIANYWQRSRSTLPEMIGASAPPASPHR
jgi:hypothetical protein